MRVFHSEPARFDAGPNMTPLVDVVMVILIFMMLSGSIGATHVLETNQSTGGGKHSVSKIPPLALELRVQDDSVGGGFRVSGQEVHAAGGGEALFKSLSARWHSYAAAGVDPADILVVVEPTANVSYQHVLTVYETTERAGFRRIAMGLSR